MCTTQAQICHIVRGEPLAYATTQLQLASCTAVASVPVRYIQQAA